MNIFNKEFTSIVKEAKVSDCTVYPYLLKYGVTTIPDFVRRQMEKFDIKPNQIIATEKLMIIHNVEAYNLAKRMNQEKIEIVIIKGLEEDELMQVTATMNFNKKMKRKDVAEVIQDLKDYMTNNEKGKIWKDEIPGERILDKIGELTDRSYGIVYSISEMYKYNADLLDKIDSGDIKIQEAEEKIKAIKEKLSGSKPKPEKSGNLCDENIEDNSEEMKNVDDGQENTEEESEDDDSDSTSKKSNSSSVRVNRKTKWMYAGEKDMKPCRKISGITIRYESGKTEEITISNGIACLSKYGVEVRKYNYKEGIYHLYDGSEFHCMNTENYAQTIQVIFTNNQRNKAA